MNVSSSVNLYVKNFLINFKKLFKLFVLVIVLLTSKNTAMISLLVLSLKVN